MYNFGTFAKFHAQIWQFLKSARISQTTACRLKVISISVLWGRREYMCNFCKFGKLPSFTLKYGNFENRPISRKPLPVEEKYAQFQPLGVERVHVQLLALWPIAKFNAQIWQF